MLSFILLTSLSHPAVAVLNLNKDVSDKDVTLHGNETCADSGTTVDIHAENKIRVC